MSLAPSKEHLRKALTSGRSLTVVETKALLVLVNQQDSTTKSTSSLELEHAQNSALEIKRVHHLLFAAHPDIGSGLKKCIEIQMDFLSAALGVEE